VVVNTRWSRDTYDGLGRVIRTERGDTSNNVISTVDTDYDSCACSPTGEMVRTSLPDAPGNTVHWTTYTYDGLGRTIAVQKPDGASTTTYSYFGSTTVVTDPKGSWKASTTDVYGNLVSVIEPDPAVGTVSAPTSAQSCSAAPYGMLGTCYTYDALNNLTHVDLYRNGYDQTRSFTYQTGTNWLLTATNPENGTVTYTRDAMGHVLTRVDAMGQKTTYTYDTYNRLTTVARQPNQYSNQPADACQTENYYYDTGVFGFASGASWGKLTGVSFANGTSGAYSVCPGTAQDGSTWGGINYAYAYSSAGQVTGKQMDIGRTGFYGAASAGLVANWTYDNEGRPLTMTYPAVTDPVTGNPTGTSFSYTYDTMGRPSTMTHGPSDPDSPNGPVANSIVYNANDQMTQMNYGYSAAIGGGIAETRGYNPMFQVTSIADSWFLPYYGSQSFSEQYVYSGTQNNGQITQAVEGTGETVNYQYDQLNRLTYSGSTAGWYQQYTYDGFGNMTGRNPGGVGYFNILADPATNRMVGFNYDANGNLHNGTWSYDVENRLVSVDAAGGEQYMYDASNKRIYKQNSSGETYYFYGIDGKVLGEYSVGWNGSAIVLNRTTESAYFAGKKVLPATARDRLGSVRGSLSAANRPYGENYSTGNTDGFGTYYHDASTQLDYADQRYYASGFGRFNTPDRYMASGGPSDPGSWNRYAYVGNDPANYGDSRGLYRSAEDCIENPDVCEAEDWDDGQDGQSPGPAPTKSGKKRKRRPIDTVTDQLVRGDLNARLSKFAGTNCDKVFSKVVPQYSAGGLSGQVNSTEFYNVTNPQFGTVTQDDVADNGNSNRLSATLGSVDAVTIAGGTTWASVLVGTSFLSGTAKFRQNVALHELLHAFTGWSDSKIFSAFKNYGLTEYGTGNISFGSEAISAWLSTDCTKTPTSITWYNQ